MVEVLSKTEEGDLNASTELQPKPQCPQCGSLRFVKYGWRKNDFDVNIQRYSCKACDSIFDDSNHLNMVKQAKENILSSIDASCLNVHINNNNACFQISAEDTVKNLVTKTQQPEQRFEKTKTDGTNIDLVLADYKYYMQKEHIIIAT